MICKAIKCIAISIVSINPLMAQLSTQNNYTGTWSDVNSWSTLQPDPLIVDIDEADDIIINGYITREGALSFENPPGGTQFFLTVSDTLVIEGDLTFATNAHSLTIAAGGLLVVFGNFEANNSVDLNNGGILVVVGSMTLNGGNQDYIDNGGSLYVDTPVIGNGDIAGANSVDEPIINLDATGDSGEQNLFDFIQSGAGSALPIILGNFNVKPVNDQVELNWTTLSELNFDYFEVQRSGDGESYQVIGRVEGNGNTSSERHYFFIDDQPIFGSSFYRLSAIDYDGSHELFKSESVEFLPESFELILYPNPNPRSKLKIRATHDKYAKPSLIQIYTLQGELKYQTTVVTDTETISLENFVSEIYLVKVVIDNAVIIRKLIVN